MTAVARFNGRSLTRDTLQELYGFSINFIGKDSAKDKEKEKIIHDELRAVSCSALVDDVVN